MTSKTAQQIKELLKIHDKVVIKYGAEWCGPCRTMDPVYEKEVDRLKESKSDIVCIKFENEKDEDGRDIFPPISGGIPAFKFFYKGGEVVHLKCVGGRCGEKLREGIEVLGSM